MWLNSTLLPAECSRTSNTGINGYQTKTYGYEGATGFKTVGFRSNAPAGLSWAASIGPHAQTVIEYQLASRRHPEHGYRACLGLLNLSKKYGKERLEAACHRAVHIGGMHYKNIASILSNSMDKVPINTAETESQITLPLTHANVRGSDYYH